MKSLGVDWSKPFAGLLPRVVAGRTPRSRSFSVLLDLLLHRCATEHTLWLARHAQRNWSGPSSNGSPGTRSFEAMTQRLAGEGDRERYGSRRSWRSRTPWFPDSSSRNSMMVATRVFVPSVPTPFAGAVYVLDAGTGASAGRPVHPGDRIRSLAGARGARTWSRRCRGSGSAPARPGVGGR